MPPCCACSLPAAVPAGKAQVGHPAREPGAGAAEAPEAGPRGGGSQHGEHIVAAVLQPAQWDFGCF